MSGVETALPLGLNGLARYRVTDARSVAAMVALHGWAIESLKDEAKALHEAAAAIARWRSLGLPCEHDASGALRYDIAEVINFAKAVAPGRGDRSHERMVRQARTLIVSNHPAGTTPDAPCAPDRLPAARFTVTFQREFSLAGSPAGGERLLRLPMPVDDGTMSDLEFERLPSPEPPLGVTIGPGRVDLRVRVPASPTVTCGARWSFICDPAAGLVRGGRLDDDERRLYLRPVEGVVRIDERIRALADEIAGGERSPRAQVQRFFDHALDRLSIGVLHYDELDRTAPFDRVLETGWTDCQMASALIVALCRARGIPARLVSGLVLIPAAPFAHFWLEAWLGDEGWAPWDFMAADLSRQGRDAAWRDHYAGRVDYRMKTQVLPRVFNLLPSVRLPRSWHMVARRVGGAVESATFDNATGALVYADRVSVRREDSAAPWPSVNATPL